MQTLRAALALIGAAGTLAAQTAPVTFDQVLAARTPAPTHRIAYGDGPLQFGHLRLPAKQGPHPVVVFIHGGCWLSRFDIAHAAPLEQAWADAGHAVWSVEYRRIGDAGGGWPGTFQDVARGVDYLRKIAATHVLNLRRVVVAGHSAGAQLALWVAARRKIPAASELYAADPLPVMGVLALAPAPDLEDLHRRKVCDHVMEKLMGGAPEQVPARYAAVSPMQLAPIGVPTRALIGEADRSWAPIGRAYVRHAQERGDMGLHVKELPGAGHFDVIAPFSPAWREVMAALEALFADSKSPAK